MFKHIRAEHSASTVKVHASASTVKVHAGFWDIQVPDVTDVPVTISIPCPGVSVYDVVMVQPVLPALVVPIASSVTKADTVEVLVRSLAGDVAAHTVRWKYLWCEAT